MKKTFYYLLILSLYFSSAVAQTSNTLLPTIIPSSPEAMSIAQYVNYPINYCSGLAQIEIPLFEVQSGDITLPVSLSFHASGLKTKTIADWVGLGWTLNAAPSISCSVKGLPDERGYLYSCADYNNIVDIVGVGKGTLDSQPDEFYYKLCNSSGGFFFYRNDNSEPAKAITIPFKPIKIDYEQLPKIGIGFRITDEKGLFYRFGDQADGSGYYTENTNFGAATTSWKCTEICSNKTNRKINFTYEAPYYFDIYSQAEDMIQVEDSIPNYTKVISYFNGEKSSAFFVPVTNTWDAIPSFEEYPYCGIISSYKVQSRKLKCITFDNGNIDFIHHNGTGRHDIEWIKIRNNNNQIVKQFHFFQTPYNVREDGYKVMRLDSIQILDKAGNIAEVYRFDYYNHTYYFPTLKEQVGSDDFWGYYNGINRGTNIPLLTIKQKYDEGEFTIGADTRNSHLEMETGMIKSIIYPTGRKSEFEYETNRYWRIGEHPNTTGDWPAGGLRIKRITETDPINGEQTVRNFVYGIAENGLGIIRHQIEPDDFMYEKENREQRKKIRTFTPNSITDLFYSEGSPVLYEEVTEYFTGDKTGNDQNGKIVYRYAINEEECKTKIPGTTLVFNKRNGWKNGLLLSQTQYKYVSGNYIPVMKTEYAYKPKNMQQYITHDTYDNWVVAKDPHPTLDHGRFISHTNIIESGCIKPVSETTTCYYDNGDTLTTTHNYIYENSQHLYPTIIETFNSDDKVSKEIRRYPSDLSLSGNDEIARQKLLEEGRINTLLQYTVLDNGDSLTTTSHFNLFGNKAYIEKVSVNTGENNSEEERVIYHKYDSYGNPLHITKDNSQKIVYLWGYKAQYPIAEIKQAGYEDVTNIIPEAQLSVIAGKAAPSPEDIALINQLRETLPSIAQVTTFTYEPLTGVTSITDPRNQTIYYKYDPAGRLEEIYRLKNGNKEIIEAYKYNFRN